MYVCMYIQTYTLPEAEEALKEVRGPYIYIYIYIYVSRYYLATHPPEAEEALRACARNAWATAKRVKNSVPGVRGVQRDLRNRFDRVK